MQLNSLMSGRKAQIASIDLFVALTIWAVLLLLIVLSWNLNNNDIIERLEFDSMASRAFQISDTLIKDRGFPSNWNSGNVSIIGFAAEDRILSQEKVSAFTNLSYNASREIFKAYGENFYFALRNLTGENITSSGMQPAGSRRAVSVMRYVLYNNETAVMEFTLWK